MGRLLKLKGFPIFTFHFSPLKVFQKRLDILESAVVIEQLENFIDQIRPEESIRDKLDMAYRIENQSVIIYTIRSHPFEEGKKVESRIAKTTYVRTKKIWKIYWLRGNLKWYQYDSKPEVKDIADFLKIVKEDKYGCFWG